MTGKWPCTTNSLYNKSKLISRLNGITEKSLNAFYYACSYAKIDCSAFMNTTARIALKLVPSFLDSYPVLLCVDDTMVPKIGKKFEQVSILFDHAAHNGNFLPEWTLFCQCNAVCSVCWQERWSDSLYQYSARVPHVEEKRVQTGTGSIHDPSGNAGIHSKEAGHYSMWQLVCEEAIHRVGGWI